MNALEFRRLVQEAAVHDPRLKLHLPLSLNPKLYVSESIFFLNNVIRKLGLQMRLGLHTRFGARGDGRVGVKTNAGVAAWPATWSPKFFESKQFRAAAGDPEGRRVIVAMLIAVAEMGLPAATVTAA